MLQLIQQGYDLSFLETLPRLKNSWLSEDHLSLLRHKVQTLLAKGAIERVQMPDVGRSCYSRYFLVPKRYGGLRPILDLCPLNAFLK